MRAEAWTGRRLEAVALVTGLAIGGAVGAYVKAWWGSGLFSPTSTFSAIGLIGIAMAVVAATIDSVRSSGAGRTSRAGASAALAFGLVGGVLGGALLGPPLRPGVSVAGTVSVHVERPARSDVIYGGFCQGEPNTSPVARILAGTWDEGPPGRACWQASVGWNASGQLFVGLGREGVCYDSAWPPNASLDVRALGRDRFEGEIAFSGLQAEWSTYPVTSPPPALAGTIRWTCGGTAAPSGPEARPTVPVVLPSASRAP